MLCFGSAKSGYFVDELWSYGLSNSYFHAHVYSDNALSDWVDGSYFSDYIEISDDERFSYDSVIYNQENDNHPPLFYFVLNTVSSLFPNTFSKWYGILPNIIYFIVAQFALLLISRKLFGKDSFASLLPMAIFGFTAGAISYTIYIRMYMMAAMWLLILINFHIKGITRGKLKPWDYAAIALVTFFGFMTHYYFIIFAFFMAAFYFFWLVIKKKGIGAIICYCVAMLSALGLEYLAYPKAYEIMFAGQRGEQAVNNILDFSNLASNIRGYLTVINKGLFGRLSIWLVPLALVMVISAVVLAVLRKKKVGSKIFKPLSGQTLSVIMLMLASFFFFIIVTKVAPYRNGRYVFMIYPIITLAAVYLGYRVIKYITLNQALSVAIVAVMGLSVSIYGDLTDNIEYLYTDNKNNEAISAQYEGSDCLYFSNDWYLLAGNALELRHMGRVRALGIGSVDGAGKLVDTEKNDHIIVYLEARSTLLINSKTSDEVKKNYYTDTYIERVRVATGYKYSKYLFTSRTICYLLYN